MSFLKKLFKKESTELKIVYSDKIAKEVSLFTLNEEYKNNFENLDKYFNYIIEEYLKVKDLYINNYQLKYFLKLDQDQYFKQYPKDTILEMYKKFVIEELKKISRNLFILYYKNEEYNEKIIKIYEIYRICNNLIETIYDSIKDQYSKIVFISKLKEIYDLLQNLNNNEYLLDYLYTELKKYISFIFEQILDKEYKININKYYSTLIHSYNSIISILYTNNIILDFITEYEYFNYSEVQFLLNKQMNKFNGYQNSPFVILQYFKINDNSINSKYKLKINCQTLNYSESVKYCNNRYKTCLSEYLEIKI